MLTPTKSEKLLKRPNSHTQKQAINQKVPLPKTTKNT
jgi:hypothetical protein